MLDRRGAEPVGKLREDRVARRPVVVEDAHLDQAVRGERGVDLAFDAGCEPFAADHRNRVEVVGEGALFPALGSREFDRWHAAIIVAAREAAMKSASKGKKLNRAWLHDHLTDPYVKLAQKEGYRSRAAYKLKEIDEAQKLFRPGQLVVDLGAAPGAWSQYLRRRFAPGGAAHDALDGEIIALDLLDFEPIDGVRFLQGDFHDESVVRELDAMLAGRKADVVVSDMAPNLSGIPSSDSARIALLVELAVDFARKHLAADGALVCKVFHGSGYSQLVELFKQTFRTVKAIKPKASRDRSAETFLVGRTLKAADEPADSAR